MEVGSPISLVDISRVENGRSNMEGWGWLKHQGGGGGGSSRVEYSANGVVLIRGVVEDRPPPQPIMEGGVVSGLTEGQ
jgi:hypothetical protein